MKKGALIILAVLLLLPLQAVAFDASQLQINGFLSQGYIDSSENNFLTPDSIDGTTEFNEIGLTINTQISDKLRAGMQLLSRDIGEVGNNEVNLDWGFADYRQADYLGIRIGKVKMPIGLYNEGRDTDMLRPMIFLPQSIYDEGKRDLLVAYQGAGLYGNLPLGPLGDVDYHGFYGSVNFDDNALMLKSTKQGASFALTKENNTFPGPVVNKYMVGDVKMNNDYTAGGSLVMNTALDGLRAGLSWFTVKNSYTYSGKTITAGVETSIAGTGEQYNRGHGIASLEYTLENLLLAGEYGEKQGRISVDGLTIMDVTSQSWYVMAAYTFFDRLTVSALYDVMYPNKDDKDGVKFAASDDHLPAPAQQRQDFFAWRKDFGVGVRYDITPNWLIKAEYHDIDGAAIFMTALNDAADLEQDWNYFALKTSVNF